VKPDRPATQAGSRAEVNPAVLERRWTGQYGAGRVRHHRSLPRQHCVRIAGRQGVCTGTAAGKQGVQQSTELAEDRVGDIHSRGRVRPGRGGNGHWIVDKQRVAAEPPQRSRCQTQLRQLRPARAPYPASLGSGAREHSRSQTCSGTRGYSSNSAEAPSASDTQVTPATMLIKGHN
jgi:hypothetical protein